MSSNDLLQELQHAREDKTRREAEIKAEEDKAKKLEDEAKVLRRHADELKHTLPALIQKESQLTEQIHKVVGKPK